MHGTPGMIFLFRAVIYFKRPLHLRPTKAAALIGSSGDYIGRIADTSYNLSPIIREYAQFKTSLHARERRHY